MKVTTVGIDLAKNLFQVHGVNEYGKVVTKKQIRRDQLAEFFVNLTACLIGRPCKTPAARMNAGDMG